jgi:hypothetical protein
MAIMFLVSALGQLPMCENPSLGPALTNASALRCRLLYTNRYDRQQPPPGPTDDQGVAVRVGLNLAKIYGVDMVAGTFDMHVWLRVAWIDSRLAWSEAENGGVKELTFFGDNKELETAQVWVPDIELVNGVSSSYEITRKDVLCSSSGSCFWSRPGRLSALCNQAGLQNFPFDDCRPALELNRLEPTRMMAHVGPACRSALQPEHQRMVAQRALPEPHAVRPTVGQREYPKPLVSGVPH